MKNICWTLLFLPCFAWANAPLTLVLDYFVNPSQAPIFVAQEQGFYKQQGLDIKIVAPTNSIDPSKWVATGKADIAIAYQPQLYLQAQQGLPLIRIGTLIDKPLSCVTVLAKGPIHSLADLKGKTIAYSSGGIANLTLGVMLAQHHVALSEVNVVDVNFNLVQALLSHRAAAISGGFRNVEPEEIRQAGYKPLNFYPENNGVPPYDALIFVANKKKSRDPRLKKFLLATQQGVAYLRAHPNSTWQTFAKAHPDINNDLNKRIWAQTIPYFASDPSFLDKAKYQQFADFLYKNHRLKQKLALQDYAVSLNSTNR